MDTNQQQQPGADLRGPALKVEKIHEETEYATKHGPLHVMAVFAPLKRLYPEAPRGAIFFYGGRVAHRPTVYLGVSAPSKVTLKVLPQAIIDELAEWEYRPAWRETVGVLSETQSVLRDIAIMAGACEGCAGRSIWKHEGTVPTEVACDACYGRGVIEADPQYPEFMAHMGECLESLNSALLDWFEKHRRFPSSFLKVDGGSGRFVVDITDLRARLGDLVACAATGGNTARAASSPP
jgi:hypothetical protein